MPDPNKDRAIDGLARRQHGVFHHRQAVRIGITRAERRSRLSSGRWVRLLESQVYALPSHPGTWLRQCMAATLSVPASAVSGAAAAGLHRFEGWSQAGIEVCTRHGTTHESPFGAVHETRTVGRIMVVEGIRVVSPADCVVQLAGRLDADALGALIDDVAIGRRLFLPELRDRYAVLAHRRLPGIRALRAALEVRGEGHVPPPSELGRRLAALLAAVGTTVELEHSPLWVEPGAQRVDAWLPEWGLIVEADGRTWHTRVADFDRDRERDAVALAHGVATLRLSWHQLVHRAVWCRNVLLAAGERRSGGCGRPATRCAGSMAALARAD